jgi:outer membrane protein assembly factor BamB
MSSGYAGYGGNARRTYSGSWRPLIALTVIVVLLCAWLGERLGSEEAGQFDPSTTGLTQLWAHNGSSSAYFYGMDTHGGSVDSVTTTGVAAYDQTSGATRWTWTPPPGDGVCAAASSGGILVVAYARRPVLINDFCSEMVAIDEADGAVLWSRPEPGGQQLFLLAAGDGRALAEVHYTTGGVDSAELDDYDLATGAPGWTDSLDAELAAGCNPMQPHVEGGTISVFEGCLPGAPYFGGEGAVLTYDASTGKQLSDLKLAAQSCGSGGILKPGPGDLLMYCSGTLGLGSLSLAFLDPATGSQHTVQVDTGYFTPTVVYGDTAYLTLETPENDTRADDQAVAAAFDLSTGDELWQHPVPGYQVTMISANSSGALAAVYNGSALSLVRYAPTDGTPTIGPGMALDAPADAVLSALARNGDLDLQLDGDVLLIGGARNSSTDFETQTDPGTVGVSVGGGF